VEVFDLVQVLDSVEVFDLVQVFDSVEVFDLVQALGPLPLPQSPDSVLTLSQTSTHLSWCSTGLE
jgi:hypothetical protein